MNKLEVIGEGKQDVVYDLGDGRVLKLEKKNDEYSAPWLTVNGQIFSVIEPYLVRYLPDTIHYQSLEGENIPEAFHGQPGIVQERIHGKVLNEITDKDLDNPNFLSELVKCMEAISKITQETHELIDWFGFIDHRNHFLVSPLNSSNVMYDESNERIVLVDTNTMVGPLIPVSNEGSIEGFEEVSLTKAIFSLLWFLKRRDFRGYFSFLGYVVNNKTRRLFLKVYFKTVFKLYSRMFKRRLKKLQKF